MKQERRQPWLTAICRVRPTGTRSCPPIQGCGISAEVALFTSNDYVSLRPSDPRCRSTKMPGPSIKTDRDDGPPRHPVYSDRPLDPLPTPAPPATGPLPTRQTWVASRRTFVCGATASAGLRFHSVTNNSVVHFYTALFSSSLTALLSVVILND